MELHRRLNLVNQDIQTIASGKYVDDRPEGARSPSPDPVYNENGIRVNSRDQRAKEKLQKQRYDIITEIIKRNPSYKPPSDYRPEKKTRRIMIPVHDHPGYNFIGLILGPRGNTHRRMEAETGAKIFIRGRGSVKEGRERREKPDPSDNDDLHVQIIAEDDIALNKAATMLERLLSPVDDELNQHKQNQLIELAKINGTLRNDEYWQMMKNEKEKGDIYQLPAAAKQSADAQYRRDMAAMHGQGEMLDDEYSEFMKELGGETGTQSGRWQDRPVHASAAAVPPQNGPELPGPPPREGLGFRENEREMMRERERESSREDPRNLYVGFLPPSIQEMGLQALFETIGPVLDCRLIYDRQTGQHKGYGFIKMAEEWMAYEAMQRLNTYMVDGKRIAVRRRMGRRNERDSGPGMDSNLPWAQSSGYGPEHGAAGQYPPPPYPYESAEAPNGLPYPPPLPNGYPAGAYPAAPETRPAAAEEADEEEEERPPGMEEEDPEPAAPAEASAAETDVPEEQASASLAQEPSAYTSDAVVPSPDGYERHVHMDVTSAGPEMHPSFPYNNLPGPPPLDPASLHASVPYMYPSYPAWTSFEYPQPVDEEEPTAPGAEVEDEGPIPEDPGEDGQEATAGAWGEYGYAYGDPSALGPEAYGYTAEEWAAWEAHAAVMQQAQNAEAETERVAEEARRSEALRPPEVKLRIPKKHRDHDLVVQVVKLTEAERQAAANAELAAGEAGRKKRAGRNKSRAGEGESIILRDELAGPMRSAGPIRTAADMHRMAEEATRAARAEAEARRSAAAAAMAASAPDMPSRPRAYRSRRAPSPSRSPSFSPSPSPSPEPVKEPTPEPSEDGELPAESGAGAAPGQDKALVQDQPRGQCVQDPASPSMQQQLADLPF
ncbi:hypothetical protein WJX84_012132 [Apatococcus fuscideae]|uniref:RRM domain-containing protein n=1 Tax=Apatococcus fuscideae TaxID=2026836 RepID=A0AAW1SLX1_9CHLO